MRVLVTFANYISCFRSLRPVFHCYQTILCEEMENPGILNSLLERLVKAEESIKLLNTEVKSIRQELTKIKRTVIQGPLAETINKLAASKQRKSVLLASPPDIEAECPPSKRPRNDDVTDNASEQFKREGDYVVAFTDGACENNGKSNAKAGIGVWFGDYNPLNISEPVCGRPTNNTAEIQACVECLKVLRDHGVEKVKICTDSKFTIDCMTKWIGKWKKNAWKTVGGQPVKNKEDLVKLDAIMKDFLHVDYVHVAGHKGIKGNEEADRLARQGALRYKN